MGTLIGSETAGILKGSETMATIKDALREAFNGATAKTTADEILNKAEGLIDPGCKEDLLSVSLALNYSPLYAATNELMPKRGFFLNASTVKLMYSLLLDPIGFAPQKAYEILDILMYAKNLDSYDVTLVEPTSSEKSTPSEKDNKNDSPHMSDIKDDKSKRREKSVKDTQMSKRRHNKEFIKEMEELYHTAFIRWLYLGSYALVISMWTAPFIMMLLSNEWVLALAVGGVSTMLTLAAGQIIPLIKQSYERSMTFAELSCFVLKIKGENPEESDILYEYEIEMPDIRYRSKRGA